MKPLDDQFRARLYALQLECTLCDEQMTYEELVINGHLERCMEARAPATGLGEKKTFICHAGSDKNNKPCSIA